MKDEIIIKDDFNFENIITIESVLKLFYYFIYDLFNGQL